MGRKARGPKRRTARKPPWGGGGVQPSRIHSGDLGYSHMAMVWQGLYSVVCSGLGLVDGTGSCLVLL